jgi:Bacterial Ig-like domain
MCLGFGGCRSVEEAWSKSREVALCELRHNGVLRDSDTNPDPVSGTVSYDSTSNKATLSPIANLDHSTTYTATVKGGANGVKDTAGNPLSADEVWTFTTAPAALSNLTATRSGSLGNQSINLSWTDNSSYETGFVIERFKDNNFTTIDRTYTTSANTTSYRESANLLEKTTYQR